MKKSVKNKRPTKLKTLMKLAEVISAQSHDAETKIGCVLVSNKSGAILAMGYNGFVRGAPDKTLPNTRPEKYQFMVHAEENLSANCAKHGISMDNCQIICTMSPCVRCMRLLFQCGITTVIVKEKYRDFEALTHMGDLEITESKTPEGYYSLTYTPKKV